MKTWGQCPLDTCDVIVVLGGDGAMLHGVHKYRHLNKPFFGLNFGHRGALMNPWKSIESVPMQVESAQRFIVPSLHVQAVMQDGTVIEDHVINEISFHRLGYHTLCLSVYVNGQILFTKLCGDGLIVATPLGSHAYANSAGGPLVAFDVPCLVLTPVCPLRQHNVSSWIVNAHALIDVVIHEPAQRMALLEGDILQYPHVHQARVALDPTKNVCLLKNKPF